MPSSCTTLGTSVIGSRWACSSNGSSLVDTFIDRAQSHAAFHRRTPALADFPQTLAQAEASEYVLIQIQPKALELLQDREGADHVMLPLLTLQHRHLQVF